MHKLLKISLFLLFFSMAMPVRGQDERFFRQIFTGELGKEQSRPRKDYKWEVYTPAYKIDLDGDGAPESITISKRDAEDWLEISGKDGVSHFLSKIPAIGVDSSLFRINLVSLSPNLKALLLSFYEGHTNYMQFNGTARLFIVSYEDNKLNKMTLATGPSFWMEREKIMNQYFKRLYSIDVSDLDSDQTKEIVVSFNSIKRVLFYTGKGQFRQP